MENPGNSTLAVYESNGSVKWNYTPSCGGVVLSTPFYEDGKIYIGYSCGKVVVLNASTGDELWNYSTGRSYGIQSSPVVFNGVVYFGDNGGLFYAVNTTSHEQLWNYSSGGGVSSAVICNIQNWQCLHSPITGMNNTYS